VFSVSSGNPNLEPIRATTYDLSAEWYFAKDALLSVGLFYKDIDSYIQTSRISQPFSGLGPAGQPAGRPGRLGQRHLPVQPAGQHQGRPAEGDRGQLPAAVQLPAGPAAHTGAIFNATVVDSKIDYISARSPTGFVQDDLVGLSKNAFNATLYYEDDAFSARVSAAYRDKYLTAVPSGTSTNDIDGVRAITTIDASASYAINKRLKLTFEGLNLTDAFNVSTPIATGTASTSIRTPAGSTISACDTRSRIRRGD
jgi:iron complex outermembrane receptor protein